MFHFIGVVIALYCVWFILNSCCSLAKYSRFIKSVGSPSTANTINAIQTAKSDGLIDEPRANTLISNVENLDESEFWSYWFTSRVGVIKKHIICCLYLALFIGGMYAGANDNKSITDVFSTSTQNVMNNGNSVGSSFWINNPGDIRISSYERSNGTTVDSHWRTKPDNTTLNNYSGPFGDDMRDLNNRP